MKFAKEIGGTYFVVTDLGDLGIGFGDPQTFSDACDQYAEDRGEGHDAAVFRLDHAEGTKCGMYVDVTDDADERIRHILSERRQEWPEWLGGPTQEELDREAAEDRAHEQQERHGWEQV